MIHRAQTLVKPKNLLRLYLYPNLTFLMGAASHDRGSGGERDTWSEKHCKLNQAKKEPVYN